MYRKKIRRLGKIGLAAISSMLTIFVLGCSNTSIEEAQGAKNAIEELNHTRAII